MIRTCASSITTFCSARAEMSEIPARRVYRLRKSFAVVHLEQTGKGRIVFLPRGAELRVIGSSYCLCEGFEVTYERQLYNIFKADLLGPWSDPIESNSIESSRSQTMRAERAVGACA